MMMLSLLLLLSILLLVLLFQDSPPNLEVALLRFFLCAAAAAVVAVVVLVLFFWQVLMLVRTKECLGRFLGMGRCLSWRWKGQHEKAFFRTLGISWNTRVGNNNIALRRKNENQFIFCRGQERTHKLNVGNKMRYCQHRLIVFASDRWLLFICLLILCSKELLAETF